MIESCLGFSGNADGTRANDVLRLDLFQQSSENFFVAIQVIRSALRVSRNDRDQAEAKVVVLERGIVLERCLR